MRRNILVVGATGQQGKATIDALYKTLGSWPGCEDISILALTRSITSPKAQALQKEYPSITLVQGDTQTPQSIFEQNPSISSVFIVTVPPNDEAQALPLIEAASSHASVDHIVFSSVDRGGDEVSWTQPTEIPHFAAKDRIELRLRELCKESNKRWTILRPTGFMDSYNPGFFGQMMASLWAEGMPKDRASHFTLDRRCALQSISIDFRIPFHSIFCISQACKSQSRLNCVRLELDVIEDRYNVAKKWDSNNGISKRSIPYTECGMTSSPIIITCLNSVKQIYSQFFAVFHTVIARNDEIQRVYRKPAVMILEFQKLRNGTVKVNCRLCLYNRLAFEGCGYCSKLLSPEHTLL
ncbi:hypothetical protein FBULB1_1728 [Fusarium bulbicola]|nr:hypothetical protein FBULB1_1728 [Fusarium bulbicola]